MFRRHHAAGDKRVVGGGDEVKNVVAGFRWDRAVTEGGETRKEVRQKLRGQSSVEMGVIVIPLLGREPREVESVEGRGACGGGRVEGGGGGVRELTHHRVVILFRKGDKTPAGVNEGPRMVRGG